MVPWCRVFEERIEHTKKKRPSKRDEDKGEILMSGRVLNDSAINNKRDRKCA